MFPQLASVILLLLSLLIWTRAPTFHFWLIAIILTEYCWIPLCMTLALFVWEISIDDGIGWLLIALLAGFSYASPLISAWLRRQVLVSDLYRLFPGKKPQALLQQPFRIAVLVRGLGKGKVFPLKLTYKLSETGPLSLSFYSAGKGLAPVVLVIHGGSWQKGDNTQLKDLNSYLALSGYHVAAMNYRLAPLNHFPAPVEDTADALDYLKAHAPELGIDPDRMVLLGRSAGGQIALMTAYTRVIPEIRGVIALYTPADMVWGALARSNKCVLNIDQIFLSYLGATYRDNPQWYEQSSPCAQVSPASPPTLIIHGRRDSLVAFAHSTRLKAKLDQCRVRNYLLDLPFATHGFDFSLRGANGQLTVFAMERFLESVTA